jgi:hypothetical protein
MRARIGQIAPEIKCQRGRKGGRRCHAVTYQRTKEGAGRGIAGERLSPTIVWTIHRESGGNPRLGLDAAPGFGAPHRHWESGAGTPRSRELDVLSCWLFGWEDPGQGIPTPMLVPQTGEIPRGATVSVLWNCTESSLLNSWQWACATRGRTMLPRMLRRWRASA